MVTTRVLIEGPKVQEVGYRLFLLEKALESGLTKIYARNLKNNAVELLLVDLEEKVDNYYKAIQVEKPGNAIVEKIKQEPYSGNVPIPPIEKYFQFLTLEQLIKGREEVSKLENFGPVIASSLKEIGTTLSAVVVKYGTFGQRVESLDGKLSNLGDKMADLNEGTSSLNEKMGGVNNKLSNLNEKMGGVDDKLSSIDDKMGKLPERIAEAIKEK